MDKAYKFKAKSVRGQIIEGTVYAKNKALAFSKLKRGQLVPISGEFSLGETLSGWLNPSFNKKELSRFYSTIGRRLQNGAPLSGGLDAAIEYLQDPRLKQAVIMFKQAVVDGQSESTAMQIAGFPKRDCLIIHAAMESGNAGDAFISLSTEIQRTEKLRKGLAATFRMPKIMGGFMAIFIWAAITFIAPVTLAFFKNTGIKMKLHPMIEAYFDFVRFYQKAPVFGSIIYFGLLISIIMFLRSNYFKQLSDKIEMLRMLSIKSDQATTWNSFYLLFKAAVPPKEAGALVAEAANRSDTKQAFTKMSKFLDAGEDLEISARNAGFPSFIVTSLSAAKSSGNTEAGIKDMVGNLEEDAATLTELIQESAKFVSLIGMGLGLIVVFMLTYYPMVASVLSNV